MPNGFSSARAAAFRPFTRSLSTSGSSLTMRTRLTGRRVRWPLTGRLPREGGRRRKAGFTGGQTAARGARFPDSGGGEANGSGRHRLDTGSQSALVTRRLVLVDY